MQIKQNNNWILIKINNKKHRIQDLYFYTLAALVLGIFPSIYSSFSNFIEIFLFFMILNLLRLLIENVTILSNEEMTVSEGTISLKFTSFGKKLRGYTILNNALTNIEYHETFFSSINWSPVLWSPNRCRRLKLITDKQIYRFGYNLSREEFDIIKKLILKQREIYQQNLEK